MPDLNDFHYFAEVAQRGGFSAAARELKVPKSRLSRRIAELERQLGVRLLQRTTRHLRLTPIGEDFLVHCRAMSAEAQAAQEVIERGLAEPRGRLRVSAPIQLAQRQLAPALPRFLAAYPKVTLELEVTNRRIDVVAEGFDVALRARRPPLDDSDLIAKPLGIAHSYLVASPRLFATRPPPRTPDELSAFPSLSLTARDRRYLWSLSDAAGATQLIEHHPLLVTDEMAVLREAALAGNGIVMLPDLVHEEDFAQGRLLRLLPEWKAPYDLVHAVYASRRGTIPAVQVFLDFVTGLFEAELRAA